MTPEMAFSHPFISKAVNELKCLRTTGGATSSSAHAGATSGGHQSQSQAASDTNGQPGKAGHSPTKNSVATNDGKSATISQGGQSARSHN